MSRFRWILTAWVTGAMFAASAFAAKPVAPEIDVPPWTHLIGGPPVIRTPWVDLTRTSRSGDWWFRLQVDAQGKVTRATLLMGPRERRNEASDAARRLRFKPFDVDGKPSPVQFEFRIAAPSEDYVGPSSRSFPSRVDLRQVRIALKRTACFGNCPDYWVEVRGDGRVSYRGSQNVVVEGRGQWWIEPAAAERLLELFRQADYFHLDGYYTVDATDLPTYVTRLSVQGQRKIVLNYGGGIADAVFASTSSGVSRPRMPPAVTELEDAVDALSGVRSWVQGDESTMAHLRRAKWNFRSQAAGRGLKQLLDDCQLALARDFIRAGAPVHVKSDHDDRATVAIAAGCGDAGLVQALVSRGALRRQEDAQALLVSAVWNGYPEFVRMALDHRADVKQPNDVGDPFIFSVTDTRTRLGDEIKGDLKPDFAEVVRLLVAAGADPNARDKEGNVPLHAADDADVVRALVRAGADPNARNLRGETPLFNSFVSEVKLALVEAGADISARDLRGRTALFGQTHADTVLALVMAGAEVNATDLEGNTPLETAYWEDPALALLDAGASLPSDPARLSALIQRATDQHWEKLLPRLMQVAESSDGKASP